MDMICLYPRLIGSFPKDYRVPILLGLLGIIVTAYIWANRARDAGHMVNDLADMAGDVRAAARRFGFSRRANVHPVESIDNPNVAAAALASAFVALDDMPTKDQKDRLNIELRRVLQVDGETSQELMVLGHWLVAECNGPQPAITRLAKKLYRLEGPSALEPLMDIIKGVLPKDGQGLSTRQSEAIDELKTAFRLR